MTTETAQANDNTSTNAAPQTEAPKFKLDNMAIGEIIYDHYLSGAAPFGEYSWTSRPWFAGQYASLKKLDGDKREEANTVEKLTTAAMTIMSDKNAVRSQNYAAAMATTLKGAVDNDELPFEIVQKVLVIELQAQDTLNKQYAEQAQKSAEQAEVARLAAEAAKRPVIAEVHVHEAETDTRARRNGRRFRNFCAAAALILTGAGVAILFNQNNEMGAKSDANAKATQTIVAKGDSTTLNAVDSVGRHIHTDLYNTSGKTQRMIKNMSNNVDSVKSGLRAEVPQLNN